MANAPHSQARDVEFKEVVRTEEDRAAPHLDLDDLKKVMLRVTADLGMAGMLVRDIIQLKEGSIVALNKMAGEMTDLYVNGLPLAKGEVVVIGDTLHVRISEIIGAAELLEERLNERNE